MKEKGEQSAALKQMLLENEIKANKFVAKVLLVFGAWFAVAYFINKSGKIWIYDPVGDHVYILGAVVLILSGTIALLKRGKGKYVRYFLLAVELYAALMIAIFNVYGLWATILLPVIVTCRYYDGRFALVAGLLSIIGCIVHQPIALKFGLSESYIDLNAFNYLEGTRIVVDGSVSQTILDMNLITNEMMNEYCIGQICIQLIILVCVVYIAYVVANSGRNEVIKAADMTSELHREAIEAEALRTKITISQIQPHFLYNCLSAIMAIDNNPPQTIDSIADFGKYLRENLNALTEEGNTPFEKELSHVERYVSLEKLRFGDRVNVEYDIEETDFEVPPLSVQMMVENAIKHGLTKKREPGTVWISSRREDGFYVVTIRDDGVGFDTEKIITAEHVGVGSVKKRIGAIPGASIDISSKIGEGTLCVIRIPVGE